VPAEGFMVWVDARRTRPRPLQRPRLPFHPIWFP
jgi:hypothetical protein